MIILVTWTALWILTTYVFMIVESDFVVRFIDLEQDVLSFYKRDINAYQKLENFGLFLDNFSSTFSIIKTGLLSAFSAGFVGVLGLFLISFIDESFSEQSELLQFIIAFIIGVVYEFWVLVRQYFPGKRLVNHFLKVEGY